MLQNPAKKIVLTASKRGPRVMPHRMSSSLYDPGGNRNAGKSCPVTAMRPSRSFSSVLRDIKKGQGGVGRLTDSLFSGVPPDGRSGRAVRQFEDVRIHGGQTCFP